MVGADGVAVPEIEVDVGRLGVLAPAQDQRPVAGNLRDLLRGAALAPTRGTVASNAPALTTSRRESVVASSSVTVHLHHRCVGVAGTGAARPVWPPLADCRIKSRRRIVARIIARPHGLSMTSVGFWQQEPAANAGWPGRTRV